MPVADILFPGFFCLQPYHNNDIPLKINDASTKLKLVYVDDVVKEFIHVVQQKKKGVYTPKIEPEFSITLGELAKQLKDFRNCRSSLILEKVGIGLNRALYSTFMSYLSPEQFSYPLSSYGDERGMFVEMLKTKDSGQFSFFTVHPDVTRGGHYHHSKTEKFFVIKGKARFCFRHIITMRPMNSLLQEMNHRL